MCFHGGDVTVARKKRARQPNQRAKTAGGKPRRHPTAGAVVEERSAEAATVAWVVASLTMALGQIGAGLVGLVADRFPEGGQWTMLERLLQLAAAVAALATLALVAVVSRTRRVALPSVLVVSSLLVAAGVLILTAARLALAN